MRLLDYDIRFRIPLLAGAPDEKVYHINALLLA